jgi:hypothetical protein
MTSFRRVSKRRCWIVEVDVLETLGRDITQDSIDLVLMLWLRTTWGLIVGDQEDVILQPNDLLNIWCAFHICCASYHIFLLSLRRDLRESTILQAQYNLLSFDGPAQARS